MNIDEAISFCYEKSENIKLKTEPQTFIDIATMLEELKDFRKGRADAIDDCKTILKAHHMRRTYADDFVPRVEIPFYRGLWERFNELKENNNDRRKQAES